jgi:hypothetical protein
VSLALYMDVHISSAITRELIIRDIDVLTAQLDGTTEFEDSDLLDRATQLDRVLFSQDEDLLAEAAKRQREGRHFAGVIYAHQLGVTIGQCVGDLEIIAKAGSAADLAGRVEYLPL